MNKFEQAEMLSEKNNNMNFKEIPKIELHCHEEEKTAVWPLPVGLQ